MNLRLFLLFSSLEIFFLEDKVFCFNDFPSCSTVKYEVVSSGHNSQECLNRVYPCATLEYIFEQVVKLACVTIELQDSQTLSSKHSLLSVSSLTIIGNGIDRSSIAISCEKNSGIYFESSQQVHLEKLDFTDCSVIYNPTEADYYLTAGLYFHHGSNVSITGCSFDNGVIMDDVIGEVQLTNTHFIGNKQTSSVSTSGGLSIFRLSYIGTVYYIIDGCLFEGIDVRYLNKHRFGGGLTFIHNVTASTSFLTILNTAFSNNYGIAGGGLHVNHATATTSYSFVEVVVGNNCTFKGNSASREGGGLWITGYNSTSCVTVVYITDTEFYNNSARWGGGLAVFSASKGNITVMVKGSHWIQNNAGTSGTGVGLFVDHDRLRPGSNKLSYYAVKGTFQNCTFHGNTNTGMYTNLTVVGALFAGGARINLINSLISGNNGTSLYIRHSGYATFSENVTFENNIGIHGSAIHMAYDSVIALQDGVDLYFLNNIADFERGGAIFTEKYFDIDSFHTTCVFESLHDQLQSSGNFTVTFSNNHAYGKLKSVYVSDPTNCFEDVGNASSSCLLMNSKIFRYNPNITSQIASQGNRIELSTTPRLTDGTLELMLGEHFYIDPLVQDVFGNPSSLHGYLVLVHDNQVNNNDNTASHSLVGPNYIAMDSYTKNYPFYIAGTFQNQTWSVTFIYGNTEDGYRDGSKEFKVKLVDCKPGFLYNNNSHTCKCRKDPKKNLVCPSSSTACVRYGYWYGHSGTYLAVLPCPGCRYRGRKCANVGCTNSQDFCRLDDIHNQCEPGRTGTLCSYCQTNYSFTFSALSCVKSTTCNSGYLFLIIFGIVLYWIFFILFVFMILSLNISVGSGFMYGIVYYFSVIYLYTENTITDKFLAILVRTCVALTQLCPHAIGNLKICFAESWKWNLNHKTFHYVTPVFIAITIVAIIWLSRFCRCPKRVSLSQNFPIHGITILVLFSYCSLAFVSLEILKPIKIYGDTMVYLDPDWKYFHKEHLPYALLALFMEFFIALPVCFVLLFAPCLARRLNLVKLKLKPFVDDFQACYRPECRWFAGFYFLARQFVYLANTLPQISGAQSLPPQENTALQYLNAVILIVHVSFQPYKLKWLNFLDTLLLSDILIISFIKMDSAFETNLIQKAAPYILILFPSFYLLGAVIILVAMRIQLCVKPFCSKHEKVWVNKMMWVNEDELYSRGLPTQSSVVMDSTDDASTNLVDPRNASLVDSFYKDDGEREPLLSDSRNLIHNSHVKERNITITSSSLRLSSVARFPLSLAHRNSNKASTN